MDTNNKQRLKEAGSCFTVKYETTANRNLLCYWHDSAINNNLLPELETAGWNLFPVYNPDEVKRLANNLPVTVGIIFVDNNEAGKSLDDIYSAISSTNKVTWFTLLNSKHRMGDAVCLLTANCCTDFFTPPYDKTRIIEALGHGDAMSLVKRRCEGYLQEINSFQGILGKSPRTHKLISQIQKAAKSCAPVLLTGETGTGKELTARSIHNLSPRCDGPFIAINCAALPETLIQSELFGHEKGAFTGAIQRYIGRFESASGGTLFLDEISDMPLGLQVNLLRFLEDKVVERLGGNSKTIVDTRIIAATNISLDLAVQMGNFRKDLLYRLDVLELEIPSLRERISDIEPLANFFANQFAVENGSPKKGFTQHAIEAMTEYSWPGNVRELINRVQRALIMAEGRVITPSDLGLDTENEILPEGTLEVHRSNAEIKAIHSALLRSHNNMTHAAHELGISRTSLYRLMDKFHIRT